MNSRYGLKIRSSLFTAANNNRGGTPASDTGLHRKEQAAPIDSVQELRLLRDGTHCIRCQCPFFPFFLSISDRVLPGKGTGPSVQSPIAGRAKYTFIICNRNELPLWPQKALIPRPMMCRSTEAGHRHLILACTVRNRLRLLIRCRSFACCATVHIVSGANVPFTRFSCPSPTVHSPGKGTGPSVRFPDREGRSSF